MFVVDSGRIETCFVSSFWLCEFRHFPGLAFSSHCFCGPSFSGPANSAPLPLSHVGLSIHKKAQPSQRKAPKRGKSPESGY